MKLFARRKFLASACFFGTALFSAAEAGCYTYAVPAVPASPVANPVSGSAFVYLEPFEDRRRVKDLWRGDGHFDRVAVEAKDLSVQAQAWQEDAYASMSFLWHRQVAQALTVAGFSVAVAPTPATDIQMQKAQARSRSARYLFNGKIQGLSISKRGADGLFGTTISGMNYIFSMQAHVTVTDLATDKALVDKDWSYLQTFHDPTRFGRRDRETFPVYFQSGLEQAAHNLAQDPDIRSAVGLPGTVAPSNLNPESATVTPSLDDRRPYWTNPKTGKRMDPAWNFDPADGTPRKDFVLHQPGPHP